MKAIIYLMIFLTTGVFLVGCSQGITPTEPYSPSSSASQVSDAHNLLGLFTFICDPDAGVVGIIPLRGTDMHLNALHLLEPPPYVNVSIEGTPVFNEGILDVDIGLRHPFLGQPQFTGFDVCGIVFTHGSVSGFSDPDIVMAGEDDTRLLNADGYTRWWNPAEFPHGNSIFTYKDGLLGTPSGWVDYNCTVNGYKYFAEGLDGNDPLTSLNPDWRGMFGAGQKNVRQYIIDLSGGGKFNYAVDACWKSPAGEPPYNIPDDFPPGANRPEAWNISVTELHNNLYFDESSGCSGGYLKLQIDIWDHFNASDNAVLAESASGIQPAISSTAIPGGEAFSTYVIDIPGIGLNQHGEVELLISVQSEAYGYGNILPDHPVCVYFLRTAVVKRGWAQTWGGNGFDYGMDVAIDPEGNIYTSGVFYFTVDFDPGPVENPLSVVNDDHPDIYLSKFDKCGAYQWTRTWAGPDWDHISDPLWYRVTTDGIGSVYITGVYGDTVDFDPGTGIEERTSNGEHDVFLSKFDVDGNFIWVRTWGGDSDNSGRGVTADGQGNIYVSGYFKGTVDFDPGPEEDIHIKEGPGNRDVFISKFSSDGDYEGAITWGASNILGIATDAMCNVYTTGVFTDTVDFDPGPGVVEHTPGDYGSSVFLNKFTSEGGFVWVQTWDGSGGDGNGYDEKCIAIDDSGYIFVIGNFMDNPDFDPGPGVESKHALGWTDIYLSKYDSNGNYQWVRTWGGYGWDIACGVATIPGYIYVTGHFQGKVDFDPGPDEDIRSAFDGIGFLTKFDLDGNHVWVRNNDGRGDGLAASCTTGGIYTTGRYGGSSDFDPGPGTQIYDDNGGFDICLVKFPPDGNW